MAIQFPMHVSFSVVNASMSSDVEMHDGRPCAISSLDLILLANHEAKIQLAGGERLSEVEIHFSLSSKWRTPEELDSDLAANDVGFLCYTRELNGQAFVHGAAVWPNEPLPQYLLAASLTRNAEFTIASLSTILPSDPPHSWETNRGHALRLSSVRFSAWQRQG